jgi:hypothetical protein
MPRVASCFIAFVSLLDSALLEVVDRYWARFFGCAPEALRSDTGQMGVHTGQDDKAQIHLRPRGAHWPTWRTTFGLRQLERKKAIRRPGKAAARLQAEDAGKFPDQLRRG